MTRGIARAGWDIDLREGEAHEDALVHAFLKAKIEHKADHAARRTGNVFIEYRQPSGPSGISTSTADWWAIEIVGVCWVILATERLRSLAERAERDPSRHKRGGDNNLYEGVLIPVEWLVNPTKALA